MKKSFLISLSLLMVASMLFISGCGEASETEATLKFGAGVYSSAPTATDATADKEGTGKIDVTVAAVTVDKDGKICIQECGAFIPKFRRRSVLMDIAKECNMKIICFI